MLFAGPEGVGKHVMARALAQALNCPDTANGVACGRCGTCTRIAKGQFSDVIEVDNGEKASVSIEAVRDQVLNPVGYRPFEGQRRVFIVDPADLLTVQAQDALLKTLEEPPPAAVLILISAYPDALRPTVLSRCRRVRFGALTEAEVAQVLADVHGLDRASARSRAALAGGSVAQALALDGRELEADRDAALALVQAMAGSALGARLKAAAELAKPPKNRRARESMRTRLALVSALLRDLSVLVTTPEEASQFAEAGRDADLSRVARACDADRVIAAFDLVARAQWALSRNASPKIVADWVGASL